MGKRGPRPLPTALKRARGNPGKRKLNDAEPELPPVGDLEPPEGLGGPGLAEWKRLASTLTSSGVLTEGDVTLFENYCRALTDLRRFEVKARKAGPELAIAKGFAGMVVKLRAQVTQLQAQIGLTPSSRSGVKVTKPKGAADRLREEFFGIRGGRS